MEFLEFEVPIKEILDQIEKCKSIENESDVDITKTYNLLQRKLVETKKDIYGNTTLDQIKHKCLKKGEENNGILGFPWTIKFTLCIT